MTQQPEKNIAQPRFVRAHGVATRGLDLAPKSALFEGRFGRIFRALPPADYGKDDAATETLLDKLAAAMVSAPDNVKDASDGEESGIPALFTYFGQFIDHDLTFDPASSLQRQNDPDALVDFRTPAFDLDNVYGRGLDDQPYLYEADHSFALGHPMTGENGDATGSAIGDAHDLPRATASHRAIIGDPRNDENVILSQFQGLFHRFHNRLVGQGMSFVEAQRLTRWHYQWIVTRDFLPKIVREDVLATVLPHVAAGTDVVAAPPKLRFLQPRNSAFMPLEFSAAAYRFGHSMVRPGYRLNNHTLQPIFAFQGADVPGVKDPKGLVGFGAFPHDWAIDWSRFIDLDLRPAGSDAPEGSADNQKRLQLAYRIDTSLVRPLGRLPQPVVDHPDPIKSLARRNLVRGWRMRLPSGQAVARAIGATPMPDENILIGKAAAGETPFPILEHKDAAGNLDFLPFAGNCPLWTYVLAEAAFEDPTKRANLTVRVEGGTRQIDTPQLGPVGGTIVAETFAGLMLSDPNSFWNVDPKWQPRFAEDGVTLSSPFGLRDFVAYALGRGTMIFP